MLKAIVEGLLIGFIFIVSYEIIKKIIFHREIQKLIKLVGDYCIIQIHLNIGKQSKAYIDFVNNYQLSSKDFQECERIIYENPEKSDHMPRLQDYLSGIYSRAWEKIFNEEIDKCSYLWDFDTVYNSVFKPDIDNKNLYSLKYTLGYENFSDLLHPIQYEYIQSFVKNNSEYLHNFKKETNIV